MTRDDHLLEEPNASVPLISIVVPTYNRKNELTSALASLAREVRSFPAEIIVVDDCSTDNTWEWLSNIDTIPRLRLLRTPTNSGPGPARNLGLEAARGRYMVPIDSDFVLFHGALKTISAAIEADQGTHAILFFRCLEYPKGEALDNVSSEREITQHEMLCLELGELLPVVDLTEVRSRQLRFPNLRSGGESVLWVHALRDRCGLFLNVPVVWYRTDVPNRICTLEYQLGHAADLAHVADAILELYPCRVSGKTRRAKAKRLLSSGTYHLLSGDLRNGWKRLFTALAHFDGRALAPILVSFLGARAFRRLFIFYCQRIRRGLNSYQASHVHPN